MPYETFTAGPVPARTQPSETTVTVLTPAGRGAVATVAIAGPRAAAIVEPLFAAASRKTLRSFAERRIAFGCWQPAEPESGQHAGEELVVCRLSASVVEIHCHGGQAAVAAVMQSLLARGARQQTAAAWAEQREGNRLVAEARLALAEAPSERTACLLLDQYHGALQRALDELIRSVAAGELAHAEQQLQTLIARANVGLHLTRPWRVVLAGPPNVGKSSLLNALVGYARSLVFDQPGTTRDVVTVATALEGWPVELADTAGLRETHDCVEQAGVRLTHKQVATADLVLQVRDATDTARNVEPTPQRTAERTLTVLNKCDLAPLSELAPRAISDDNALRISALTGVGLETLIGAIVQCLVPAAPQRGDAIPFTQRQIDRLRQALAAVQNRRGGEAMSLLGSV
jgi:tRNA modification GTPase